MRYTFILLLALLTGCTGSNDFEEKIVGTWEIYSLNGKVELYKGFVGTTITFSSDGQYSRSDGSKTYGEATYKLKGNVITLERRQKELSSIIDIKDLELHFEKDLGFTSGGVPMKSVYKRK